jgi:hypothetical protein
MNIYIVYFIWCVGEDFREPEGNMGFSSDPQVGDKITLCDGKEWTIKSVNREQLELTVHQP